MIVKSQKRKYADRKFKEIINLEKFTKNHLNELRCISNERIYLSYDYYFFKVMNAEVTDMGMRMLLGHFF